MKISQDQKNDLKLLFLKNDSDKVELAKKLYEENKTLAEKLLADRNNPFLVSQLRTAISLDDFKEIKKYLNHILKSFYKCFPNSKNLIRMKSNAFDFNITGNTVNLALMNHLCFETFKEHDLF